MRIVFVTYLDLARHYRDSSCRKLSVGWQIIVLVVPAEANLVLMARLGHGVEPERTYRGGQNSFALFSYYVMQQNALLCYVEC